MRFFPLQREAVWVHLPRVCLTHYVPPSGFLNLLTVFSSNCAEAVLHASSTRGVCPSEYSPQKQHRALVESGFLFHSLCCHHLPVPACRQMACWVLRIRKSMRPNSRTLKEVLFYLRVRSRPRWANPSETAVTLMGSRCLRGDVISRSCP